MEYGSGDFIRLRGRRWLVEGVRHNPVVGPLLKLSCLEDDAQGDALEVAIGSEIKPERLDDSWNLLGGQGVDDPAVFGSFLKTLDWSTATAAERDLFQAPFRAGIRLDAYQLLPLYKALRLPRVNLLIADDVGLGKTIEAGLILRELLLRRRIDFMVVAAPPAMTLQWRDELEEKFGLSFTIMDRDHFAAVRRARGFGVNPWDAGSRFIISHRLLADETYTAGLRERLGEFRPRAMMILDEAHHAAPASGSRYAISSQFTKAVTDISGRFEHRLFLTATPHNGHPNSFSTLLEMLDPQRFTRGVGVRPSQLEPIMVRRLKADLRVLDPSAFPKRVVEPVALDGLSPETPELALATMLADYGMLREQRVARLPAKERAQSRLVFSGLQQRLLSSVAAFARTLEAHKRGLERKSATVGDLAARQFAGQSLQDSDGAQSPLLDDEAQAEALANEEERLAELASSVGSAEPAQLEKEKAAVDAMLALARRHAGGPDERARWIIQWVRDNCLTDGVWNDRRLLIFTEYEDTRRWLQKQLLVHLDDADISEGRLATYTGATGEDTREAVKRAFNADPKVEPLRILLCTDAAREGVNLQMHCADLIHFDLPWNPSRLEQRNGRIDRKLQPSPEVRCRYFLYPQRPEDVVLGALVRKTETIRRELGAIGQVLEDRIAKRLTSQGIRRADAEDLARQVQAETDAERLGVVHEEMEGDADRIEQLREEDRRMRHHLERSRERVGVDPDELRNVISVAMRRAGVDLDGAKAVTNASADAFRIEPDGALAGGSWAPVFDDLRDRPRGRRERLKDWRASTRIRAISFEPPITAKGHAAEGVVQAHLEHRLVRRLLSQFLSQGFQSGLSRACLIEGPGAEPRVLLLGRLAIYGPGAARLHEEVLEVSALWTDANRDARPLKPYGEVNQEKTLAQLKDALAHGRQPRALEQRVVPWVQRDIADLAPRLEALAEQHLDKARRDLAARGDEEARSLQRLLDDQFSRIAKAQAKIPETDQLLLPGLLEDERRQLSADRDHWRRRLDRLATERESEPARVRDSYAIRAHRLEPVGIVYLWPRMG